MTVPNIAPATFKYLVEFTGSAKIWGNGMHGFLFDEWGTGQDFCDGDPQLAIVSHMILADYGPDYGMLAARLSRASFSVGYVDYYEEEDEEDEDGISTERSISNFDQSFDFTLEIETTRELDEAEIEELLGRFVDTIHINADDVAETVEFASTLLDDSETISTPDLPRGSGADPWDSSPKPRSRVRFSGNAIAAAGEKLDTFEFPSWPASGKFDLTADLSFLTAEIARYCLMDSEFKAKAKASGVAFSDARGRLATFDAAPAPDGSVAVGFLVEIDFLTDKPLKKKGADWIARLARDIAMPEDWVDPASWSSELFELPVPSPEELERLRLEDQARHKSGYLVKNW
jgi:hypothetical protein